MLDDTLKTAKVKITVMTLVNQPKENCLGDELKNILENRPSNGFDFFCIIVAYAKRSGVVRLNPSLEKFKHDGGKIKAIVGIDQGNTSFQGLEQLLPLCDEAYVYHNETFDHTFHPKIYFFEKEGEKALVFVGSNNLTAGGLYSNYETAVSQEYTLTRQDDIEKFQRIKSMFNFYSNTSSACCKRLTPELLQQIKDDYLSDEARDSRARSSQASSRGVKRQRIFGLEHLRVPPPIVTVTTQTSRQPRVMRRVRRPRGLGQAQHFAMTLSFFDCSHRRGRPGTPEISLPQSVYGFFPRVSSRGQRYNDAYFDVLLHTVSGAETVNYRIWHRPAGSPIGHADWRINVSHKTIDLTSVNGGDIILFRRRLKNRRYTYEVWIVSRSDPIYSDILSKCTSVTSSHGAAGAKRYGIF